MHYVLRELDGYFPLKVYLQARKLNKKWASVKVVTQLSVI